MTPSPGSDERSRIVTSAEGSVSSLTLKVSVLPVSLVLKLVVETETPEVSLSVFVIDKEGAGTSL